MSKPALRFAWLLVPVSGALAVTAFAPLGWYPLACLALLPLFYCWQQDTPGQALRHGLLFGLGFFGTGISWVFVSVHDYGHVPVAAAVPVTVALVLFLSLYPALLGYLVKRYLPQDSWPVLVLAYPAGWALSEWLRGWLFSGFPWLSIGNSQIDSPLGGYTPVLGVFGTGWLVALSAALLLLLLQGRKPVLSLVALAGIWAGGLLLGQVDWTSPRGEPIRVALVQGNIAQQDKWQPEKLLDSLSRYADTSFALKDIDLIVWPETAIAAFYDQVSENFIPYLEEKLQESGATLLTGIPVLDRGSWEYYNAVISLGGKRAFYYKQHLVPYGEYLPMRWLFGSTLDALAVPNADFSSGNGSQPLLQAAGYPVATSICFEVVFGEEVIQALPEAAMLVNVSNDAWFGRSLAPFQHLEMARMRARETGRPMLRATNTGISALIDHQGRIIAQSPQFEAAVVTGEVEPRQGATPYVRWGNAPIVVLCAGLLLAAGYWRRRKSVR
ncbi:MAG: apolipoprotein N-acyltransferase [Gammaproteobacteria bacterium]